MVRVPAYEDVAPLGAAAVVKAVRPPAEAVDAATEDMFAAIVPESGFKALSRYTEKVDALIREENDVLALASDEARVALREMELPELLIAAEAGAQPESPPGCGQDSAAGSGGGLPSPLDEEVASIQGAGGLAAQRGGPPRLAEMNEALSRLARPSPRSTSRRRRMRRAEERTDPARGPGRPAPGSRLTCAKSWRRSGITSRRRPGATIPSGGASKTAWTACWACWIPSTWRLPRPSFARRCCPPWMTLARSRRSARRSRTWRRSAASARVSRR